MAKREVYTSAELDWCEAKLAEWREYVDNNPIAELKDRLSYKTTSNGGSIPMVVASIESQIKSIRDTMKEYLLMLQQVESMREKEAQKTEARGGQGVSGMMDDFKV